MVAASRVARRRGRERPARAATLRASMGIVAGRPAAAFSILEILIALSLVSLVAALVIPISIGAIARASAVEAQPRLEAAVAEARLEAARLSLPVRLVAANGGAVVRIEALETPRRTVEPDDAGGLEWAGLREEAGGRAGAWVLLNEVQLPVGIVLAVGETEEGGLAEGALGLFTMSGARGAAGEDAAAVDDEEEGQEPWTFATALPDGRLEASGHVVEVRSRERGDSSAARWRVEFAAWTGAVTLTRIYEDADDASVPREEELPPPPPASEAGAARGRPS